MAEIIFHIKRFCDWENAFPNTALILCKIADTVEGCHGEELQLQLLDTKVENSVKVSRC